VVILELIHAQKCLPWQGAIRAQGAFIWKLLFGAIPAVVKVRPPGTHAAFEFSGFGIKCVWGVRFSDGSLWPRSVVYAPEGHGFWGWSTHTVPVRAESRSCVQGRRQLRSPFYGTRPAQRLSHNKQLICRSSMVVASKLALRRTAVRAHADDGSRKCLSYQL